MHTWLLAICLVVLAGPLYVSGEGTILSFYNGQNASNPLFNYSLTTSDGSCDVADKINLTQYPIWMYIHGWESALDPNETKLITAMSQKRTDYITISVDYDYYVLYTTAVLYVSSVGETVADFFSCLNTTYGFSLDNLTCVGHSLGAHICGSVGSNLDGEMKNIVGLDPAGPLFTPLNDDKLKAGDAQYVEAIHTSNLLGTTYDCGDSDYWVNGASIQPECAVATYNGETKTGCSHEKAVVYYQDTIFGDTNYTGYSREDSSETALMGRLELDTTAEGDYDVTT